MRINLTDQNAFKNSLMALNPDIDMPPVTGISIDSRNVKPGDIFWALRGDQTDGHLYINQAESSGAAYIVIEKEVDSSLPSMKVASTFDFLNDLANEFRTQFNCPLFAITGSNGKTTTKELLTHVLSANNKVEATKGNYNSTTGVPLSLLEFDTSAEFVIMEMGASEPGEIESICDVVKPDMGLITNVYGAHLEFFGSVEEVAKTKQAVFSTLPETGTAFLNMDDPYVSNMSVYCNRVGFAFNSPADYNAVWEVKKSYDLLSINDMEIKLPVPSETLGKNALAVFAAASEIGMSPEKIRQQIETFSTPEGRGNVLNISGVTIINDSYNANLESAKSGIHNLSTTESEGRKVVVLGDMFELGEEELEIHKKLGEFISREKIDAVFLTGSRMEVTHNAISNRKIYFEHFTNKQNLTDALNQYIQSGDILYIKGSRGMQMETIIEGITA